MTEADQDRDRFRGCLVGLAVGDALGAPLEFQPRGTFDPVDDMLAGGVHGLEPGQWTDDTSMALCLAVSLLESGGFDPADQMDRYVRWWRDGYLSCTGRCFDIGNTVRGSLERFERTGEPLGGPTDPMTAGNGSIMRLAPVPMFFAGRSERAVELSAESSRTTHGAVEAVDACRHLGSLLVALLGGTPKERVLDGEHPVGRDVRDEPALAPAIREIAGGSFRRRRPPEIQGSGYVVRSLEAALWAFHGSETFEEGALMAVNLGDDADTTGAVFGQLAGACYGLQGIPERWVERLAWNERIVAMAERLFDAARGTGH